MRTLTELEIQNVNSPFSISGGFDEMIMSCAISAIFLSLPVAIFTNLALGLGIFAITGTMLYYTEIILC